MVLDGQGAAGGRGIEMQGSANFNNKLVTKLVCAPDDIMNFLEACAMGSIDRVDKLLEKGVDVNATGTPSSPDLLASTTGLMMAAMSNQVDVMERLLRQDKLDVNKRGMQENTALTFAAGQGYKDIVLLLLRSGADPALTNSAGKSSLGLAADHTGMEVFIEICNQLVGAGCTGTDKDWAVLMKHPKKKLLVMMEMLRTTNERGSLRFLARKQVLETLIKVNTGKNPGSCIDKLEIPRNMKQYIKHPV